MGSNALNIKDNRDLKNSLNQTEPRGGKTSPAVPVLQKKPTDKTTNNNSKLPVGAVSQVAQLQQIAYRGINGLTHLVVMTDGGSLYNSENWLDNEREEVKFGDLLTIDLDDQVFSRRGIDQESNWKQDADGGSKNLWVRAIKLNHKKLGADQYVRMEMLSAGTTDIPKNMHSVWVQGDYQGEREAQEGFASRKGTSKDGWVNMIWLYNSGKDNGFESSLQAESMEVDSGKFSGVFERNFVLRMNLWKQSGKMPKWVDDWMPILEVLMAKKSYITMSDLMRMIILYYEGGVYMDVKIQVDSDSDLSTAPKLLINTADFYDKENWAIMADTGCRMIEEIMVKTLLRFPTIEELRTYPENYSDGSGKEGRTHANLHENRGVWATIESYRGHSRNTSLTLHNPRKVNSWTDVYEDRDPIIVLEERIEFNLSELKKLERKLNLAIGKKENLEERQRGYKSDLSAKEIIELQEIPEEIKSTTSLISEVKSDNDLLEMRLFVLKNPPTEDNVEENIEDNSEDDDWLNQLNDINVPKTII